MSTWLGALFHTSSSQPAKPVARPNPHIQHHSHQLTTISHASPRHTHRHTPSNALQPLPPMKPSVPIGGSNWGSCGPTTSYSKGNLAGDFKSQGGEDKWLDDYVFRSAKRGTYLDIGCNDGIDGSNSWIFQSSMRLWEGYCIEADPMKFRQIAAHSRRRDGINLAVAKTNGTLPFTRVHDPNGGLSGLPSSSFDASRASHFRMETLWVNATTPQQLLKKYYNGKRVVDYVSLDVEGSELDIIRAWPFDDPWCVDAWTIENNFFCNGGTILPMLKEVLGKHGYDYAKRIWVDELFVRRQPCAMGVRWKGSARPGR